MIDRIAPRFAGRLALTIAVIAAVGSAGEVAWMWSGAVTPESARVVVRFVGPEAPALEVGVADADAPLRVAPAAVHASDGGVVAAYALSGLKPDTTYRYRAGATTGRFRTFPRGPASFTLALGSCAGTGSEHAVFRTIARHDPLLFLHIGDLHYENIAVNDPAVYRAALGSALSSSAQSALYRHTATNYVWDDHDYGPNNADRTAPGRASARAVYREVVPHYPLPDAGAVYHSFTVGRVRFIVTDLRSERSPRSEPDGPARSMLGAAQKEWFFRELLAARDTHALTVWVCSISWINHQPEDTSYDNWGGFRRERAEIAAFLEENRIMNLCVVSGDAHMLAIDDGSNNRYGPSGRPLFPVFQAAALDRKGSVKGGPYSHGTFPGPGHFGLMKVHDDGGAVVEVEWSGRNQDDVELVRHRFSVTVVSPDSS